MPLQEAESPCPPDSHLSYFARATPLFCARDDSIRRRLCSVAKLRLITAAGCLTLVFLHTYWIWGHCTLRLTECSNTSMIAHVSHIDFAPACNVTLLFAVHVTTSSFFHAVSGLRRVVAIDAALHDAFFDAFDSTPAAVASLSSRAQECSECPAALPSHGSLSPVCNVRARHARATGARQNSARRSRHLKNGLRCDSFVVDSGCTWHIYPHTSDLINVQSCCDHVAGIDGRRVRRNAKFAYRN
eukprot:4946975-Pleurochrysis_carterae.AAC.1